MFSITIETVGNPDHQQYAPITEPEEIKDKSISGLRAKVRNYQLDNCIGGGNWMEPILYKDGNPLGKMSYNGRIWELGHTSINVPEVIVKDS